MVCWDLEYVNMSDVVTKIHESSAVQKKLRNCQIRLIRSHCVQRSYLTAAAPADGAAAAAERSSRGSELKMLPTAAQDSWKYVRR